MSKHSRFSLYRLSITASVIAGCLLVHGASPVSAQDDGDARERGREMFRQMQGTNFLRDSDSVVEAFGDVVGDASQSTVKLMSGRRQIAFGTIVSEDGMLVTKASELLADIKVKLGDGTELVPKILGIDKTEDIALLQIEQNGLTPVIWDTDSDPFVGSWLVSAGETPFPIGIGVVSVDARPIAPPVGVMGVFLEDGEPGAKITSVVGDSPAEKAGIQANDVVLQMDGEDIEDRPSLQALVRKKRPGDIIALQIQRGDEKIIKRLELGNRQVLDPTNQRSVQQNELGGPLNDVREGFSLAIQHDSGIAMNECGGPVVGLSGNVLGINIARAGRVKTYVLPSSVVVPVIEKLKTGDFAPSIVNQNRISKLNEDISQLKTQIEDEWSPQLEEMGQEIESIEEQLDMLKTQASTQEVSDDDKQKQEDLETRLDDLKKSYRPLSFRIRRTRRKIGELEDELKFLQTGVRE